MQRSDNNNPFKQLPKDATLHLLSFLRKNQLPNVALVDVHLAKNIHDTEHWQRRLSDEFHIHVASTVDAEAIYREAELLVEYAMVGIAASMERKGSAAAFGAETDMEAGDPSQYLYGGENAENLSTAKSFWNRRLHISDDLHRVNLLKPCLNMLASLLEGRLSFTPVEWDAYMVLGSQVELRYNLTAECPTHFEDNVGVKPLDSGLEVHAFNGTTRVSTIISWDQLPADFPHDVREILAQKQDSLRAILQHTSALGLTMGYNAVYDDCNVYADKHNAKQLALFGTVTQRVDKDDCVDFKISSHCKLPISREEAINAALLSQLLHNAAYLGLTNILNLILSQQPSFARYPLRLFHGESMLNSAIDNMKVDAANLLLNFGADVIFKPGRFCWGKVRNAVVLESINFDMTPLMSLLSAMPLYLMRHRITNFKIMLQLLLERGADIDLGSFDPTSDIIYKTPREVCADLHPKLMTDQASDDFVEGGCSMADYLTLVDTIKMIATLENTSPLYKDRVLHELLDPVTEENWDKNMNLVNVNPSLLNLRLHAAAQHGFTDTTRILIEHHADVNAAHMMDGSTPLFAAAQNGHLQVVQLLLSDANTDVEKSVNSRTPEHIARINGHAEIADMIRQAAHRHRFCSAQTFWRQRDTESRSQASSSTRNGANRP